jgi:hypothetical protein
LEFLSVEVRHSLWKECTAGPTTKPIAETYLEKSRTSERNSSTVVVEKEGRSGKKKVEEQMSLREKERKVPK